MDTGRTPLGRWRDVAPPLVFPRQIIEKKADVPVKGYRTGNHVTRFLPLFFLYLRVWSQTRGDFRVGKKSPRLSLTLQSKKFHEVEAILENTFACQLQGHRLVSSAGENNLGNKIQIS